MSEESEFWREMKEIHRKRKIERQAEADAQLEEIRDQLRKIGVSLRVCSPHHWHFWWTGGRQIGDYWPSTMKAQPHMGQVHHGVTISQIVAWVKNRV